MPIVATLQTLDAMSRKVSGLHPTPATACASVYHMLPFTMHLKAHKVMRHGCFSFIILMQL